MFIYNYMNFDYNIISDSEIVGHRKGRRSKDETGEIKANIMTFDIETTTLQDEKSAFMYNWQACIDGVVVMGRYWYEYKEFIKRIEEHLKENEKIVCYVHNLSYEFCFLRGVFSITKGSVFAVQPRKILKMTIGKIEYRCSYLLTNMGLRDFCKKWDVEHKKLDGDDYNYNIVRYPWSRLTDEEIRYCVHDVLGLYECLKAQMEFDGDNLRSIPLTSTGYPRRDVKRIMLSGDNRFSVFDNERSINPEVMELLHEAFRGGNTHASRFYAGDIVKNVKCYDRSSSYPDVLCNCKYPRCAWKLATAIKTKEDIYEQLSFGKALLMDIEFINIELKNKMCSVPYQSISKCRELKLIAQDNGRMLAASHCVISFTDVDFRIFDNCYKWETMYIRKVYKCDYAPLPKALVDYVAKLYKDKTELKGKEDDYSARYYGKVKALLNSVYGMMVQDPVKQTLVYADDIDGLFRFAEEEKDDEYKTEEELLEEHKRKCYVCYAWGVWCTAWARQRLQLLIDRIDNSNTAIFWYCDTDSVKFVGDIEVKDINEQFKHDSMKSGIYGYDSLDKLHFGGEFEQEETYTRAKTLGAKKYAYEINGELHIVIAGVNKKKGAVELRSLDNFKLGFVFKEAGGADAVYNDNEYRFIYVDGHMLEITPNVALMPSEYTLGLTEDYLYLLDLIQRVFNVNNLFS